LVSQQEAKDMRDAIKRLEQIEGQQARDANNILIAQAKAWYNTVKPSPPTNRDEALLAFQFIKVLMETETDHIKIGLLRRMLKEANEKYKEVKRLGT